MNDTLIPPPSTDTPWSRRTVRTAAVGIVLATMSLHVICVLFPVLRYDDFRTIAQSWPWEVTRANLWMPHNEHCMPAARLLTWLLTEMAGSASALPYTMALLGPSALLLALALIHRFVRREVGHPFYALFAMAMFGVTSVYVQTVYWYAAAYFLVAFDCALVGLLACQSWSQQGRLLALFWCALFTALAPTWNSIGLFAGPVCAIYLVSAPPDSDHSAGLAWWRRWLYASTPVLGTGLFLAVSLPMTANQIMYAEHYGGKSAVDSFYLDKAVENSLRSVVDNLVLGTLGLLPLLMFIPVPKVVTFLLLVPVLIGAVFWWRLATHRRLLLVGLGLIFCNYLLIYGAREEWGYERFRHWGRYQLFPHLGLVLFVVGGLPHWHRRLVGNGDGPPGWLRRAWVPALVGLILAHAWVNGIMEYTTKQHQQLAQIDAMDRRCRELRISREQALEVLPPFEVVLSDAGDNGWQFLRGSPDPLPRTSAEVRRLLLDEESPP